ncbi:MAG: hypothetical protein ACREBG_20940, partial [Pyrinomonadaceae bacterium]
AIQMQNQLPDTVSARDRMRRCLGRSDAFEDFEHGRAMPRVTLGHAPIALRAYEPQSPYLSFAGGRTFELSREQRWDARRWASARARG